MRRPSPTLSADERRLLDAVARHGQRVTLGIDPATGEAVEIAEMLAAEASERAGLDTLRLASVVWALQDPRRWTSDLAFLDRRLAPPVLRLTPEGLDVARGAEPPVEPKLITLTAA